MSSFITSCGGMSFLCTVGEIKPFDALTNVQFPKLSRAGLQYFCLACNLDLFTSFL